MNLKEADKHYVWHPFTQMKTHGEVIPIVKGEGIYLYSEDGRKIMDMVSSWWTSIHGHSNEILAKAVYDQFLTLEHVIFAGFTHPKAAEISKKICTQLPYLSKVFFSDNGSTAVEVGIKMALQFWYNQGKEKRKVIAFKNAYHGDTFGAMSVGDRNAFNKPFQPFLFDVEFIDLPDETNIDCIKAQIQSINKNNEVAAFIFEPLVQGAGGMNMYNAEILDELVLFTKSQHIICIADEVMTGFYRTGKFFATDYITNKPDIVCLSKGLTGGTMPLGLTVCNEKIYNAFYSDDKYKTFFHGHSFTANPLACAVACASFDLLLDAKTQANINNIINQHQQFAEELKSNKKTGNIRQQGTIVAFDLLTSENTSYFNNIRDVIYQYFIDKNILIRPLGNTIYLMPPYCITTEELKVVYREIFTFLDHLKR